MLQDRLISEIKLAGINTKDLANEFIEKVFLPKHNSKFQVPPAEPSSAFVPLINPSVLDETLCLQYESKVQNDNTIGRGNIYKIQLHASAHRQSWVKAKVIIRIKIDGTVIVRHSGTNEVIPSTILELKKPVEYKHSSKKTEEGGVSCAN